MTVRLVANKQDKPSSQIWRWNWLTTNKTNQTRWLMTSEFGSSWWGIKRVWLITSEFVCLDRITSSSVSCWEQQSLTRKIFGLVDVEEASPLLGVKAINKWTKLGCHVDLTNEQAREESATSTQLLTDDSWADSRNCCESQAGIASLERALMRSTQNPS